MERDSYDCWTMVYMYFKYTCVEDVFSDFCSYARTAIKMNFKLSRDHSHVQLSISSAVQLILVR